MKNRLWLLPLLLLACNGNPITIGANQPRQDTPVRMPQPGANKIDVLFMIDDSASMNAMYAELQARIADFFQDFSDLAQTGIHADLHIGVVTSDYGAGSTGGAGCDPSPGGQRGLLQAIGQAAPAGCLAPIGAPYIQYAFSAGSVTSNLPPGQDLVSTFSCMASVGSSGCGFEHQLESVYAALHDTGFNAGFLRDDALLSVVFLTNEDDGSAPPTSDVYNCDPDLEATYGLCDTYRQTRFGIACGMPLSLPPYDSSMGPLVGCVPAPALGPTDPGKEFDVSRYIDFFTRPRAQGGVKDNPEDVTLAAIDAPERPVEILRVQSGSGEGVQPDPAYVPCTPLPGQQDSTSCIVRLQHSCQNQTDPAFFGDPAIRLNAVVNRSRFHQITSICGSDTTQAPGYGAALHSWATLLSSFVSQGCVTALVADPLEPDCTVENFSIDAGGATVRTELPRCASGVFPCWRVETKAACAALSPQSLGITVDYNGAPASEETTTRAVCETVTGGT